MDGDFAKRQQVQLAGHPTYVVAGDLNGDGLDDIVATMYYEDAAAVLLANGDGSFRVEGAYSAGPGPTAAALADFDGDGDVDFAISNEEDNTVSIFLNQGAAPIGSSAAATGNLMVDSGRYVVGLGPQQVIAGDFTGDGLVDLATADGGCLTVSVLPNRGGGRFGSRIQSLVSDSPIALATADFDGDGDLDLAAAVYGGVLVLSNDSHGRFTRSTKLASRLIRCWSVAAADMNGDGSPEIIATSSLTSLIYAGMSFAMVYENHRGTFGPRLDFQTGAIPAQLIATDLDGDRDMDIVTANYNPYTYYAVQQQSSVSILENLGGKRLAAASDNFVPGSSVYDFDYPTNWITSVHTIQFPSNRVPDLILGRTFNTQLMRNRGDGLFDEPITVASGSLRAVRDLNGDGIPDLITSSNDTVLVYLGDSGGRFALTYEYSSGTFLTLLDVDRDGLPEIAVKPPYVWPDYDRWYEILLLPNLGHGSFGPPQGTGVMTSIFVDSAWEGTDFDGDGFDDLLIGRRGFL
jgi:hypothetical protein